MAKDIVLKPDEYEIIPSEPKNLDKKNVSKSNTLMYIGLGALALLFLLKRK